MLWRECGKEGISGFPEKVKEYCEKRMDAIWKTRTEGLKEMQMDTYGFVAENPQFLNDFCTSVENKNVAVPILDDIKEHNELQNVFTKLNNVIEESNENEFVEGFINDVKDSMQKGPEKVKGMNESLNNADFVAVPNPDLYEEEYNQLVQLTASKIVNGKLVDSAFERAITRNERDGVAEYNANAVQKGEAFSNEEWEIAKVGVSSWNRNIEALEDYRNGAEKMLGQTRERLLNKISSEINNNGSERSKISNIKNNPNNAKGVVKSWTPLPNLS